MKRNCFSLLAITFVLLGISVLPACITTGSHDAKEKTSADYARDVRKYTKEIEKHPKDADAYKNRGWAYLHLGEPGKAHDDFSAALGIDPDDRGAKEALRHCGVPSAAYLAWSRGTKILGRKEAASGGLDRGLEEFNRALDIAPEYDSAYNNRGVIYLRKYIENKDNTNAKGFFDLAMADFETALRLDPENYFALGNIGALYEHREDYIQAEEYHNRALRINPDFTYAKEKLAKIKEPVAQQRHLEQWRVYRDKKDYHRAINAYQKVLGLKPSKQTQTEFRTFIELAASDNPGKYPAPFAGTWSFTVPAYTIPERTEFYEHKVNTPGISWDGYYYYYETRMRTIPPEEVPEKNIVYTFNGKTYTRTNYEGGKATENKTGTFYYNILIIALDDGTVLDIADSKFSDAEKHSFTKQ